MFTKLGLLYSIRMLNSAITKLKIIWAIKIFNVILSISAISLDFLPANFALFKISFVSDPT